MQIFENAMNDLFQIEDLLESVYIDGIEYKGIITTINDGVMFSDAGLVPEINFIVDVKLPVKKIPKSGDKLIFKNEKFKVSHCSIDSAIATLKIFVIQDSMAVK